MRNWQSVLRWWWARPKSFGMSAVVLLVAAGLWFAENKGLVGERGPQRPGGVAAERGDGPSERNGDSPSIESLVVSTQTDAVDAASGSQSSQGSSQGASSGSSSRASEGESKEASNRNASGERDAKSDPRRDASSKSSASKSSASKSQSRSQPKAQEPLGKLTLVEGKTYRSTAGLVYTPGSVDGHRLKHVAAHFQDNRSKPVHGVFSGSERENFAAIDEAYLIALTEPKRARTRRERDRTTHEVDLRRKVGYVGGQKGARSSRPLTCTGIKLVLEDDRVITAFPIQIR